MSRRYSIIEIEAAVSAVKEFFEIQQIPKCIEWEQNPLWPG